MQLLSPFASFCFLVSLIFAHMSNSTEFAVDRPLMLIGKRAEGERRLKTAFIDDVLPGYEYAELELLNIFDEPLVLNFNTGLQQCFIPVVRNQRGEVLSSAASFGTTLSLANKTRTFVLAPGESKTIEFRNPWETVPGDKLKQGEYSFRVQFRRDGVSWESNEIVLSYR